MNDVDKLELREISDLAVALLHVVHGMPIHDPHRRSVDAIATAIASKCDELQRARATDKAAA